MTDQDKERKTQTSNPVNIEYCKTNTHDIAGIYEYQKVSSEITTKREKGNQTVKPQHAVATAAIQRIFQMSSLYWIRKQQH